RRHTVMVADPEGRPLRVLCDYCGSQHNYRGGGGRVTTAAGHRAPKTVDTRGPLPLVDPRERSGEPMSVEGQDIELLLRRIIREESG
ncbi:MAG: hypothetical protein GWO02_04405, partial [Gammaproteobacteria bacterium]|nr:hypothetical protein [Gammaproteobacteria bacterium]